MQFDAWHEEEEGVAAPGHRCGFAEASVGAPEGSFRAVETSECWESLQVQMKAAVDSKCFVFSHRELDGAGAAALVHYLRDECSARFVDLSCLGGRWSTISGAVAGAVQSSLRALRALTLDGNDLGSCEEVARPWCRAIEEHPGLQTLSLRDCGFRDDGAVMLSRALHRHLALFSVDLSLNRIGDVGVEALTGALTDNRVLIELPVEGSDASRGALNTLEAVLERNRGRFEGQGGCAKLLQGLRRARAEAVTASFKRRARTPAVEQPKTRREAFIDAAYYDGEKRPLTTAVDVGGERLVWLPTAPTVDEQLRCEDNDGSDGVIFEAGAGITKELALRCEAGWRYTATDVEGLRELQAMIGDLKTQRKQDRDRAEEGHRRIIGLQRSFQQRAEPMESRIIVMKEELDAAVRSNEVLYQAQASRQMELKVAEEELDSAAHEKEIAAANAQQLMLSHKLRHQEVDEETQKLQAEMARMEEDIERLQRENETFRRRLHAARFETETERFVPRWAVEGVVTAEAVTAEA